MRKKLINFIDKMYYKYDSKLDFVIDTYEAHPTLKNHIRLRYFRFIWMVLEDLHYKFK